MKRALLICAILISGISIPNTVNISINSTITKKVKSNKAILYLTLKTEAKTLDEAISKQRNIANKYKLVQENIINSIRTEKEEKGYDYKTSLYLISNNFDSGANEFSKQEDGTYINKYVEISDNIQNNLNKIYDRVSPNDKFSQYTNEKIIKYTDKDINVAQGYYTLEIEDSNSINDIIDTFKNTGIEVYNVDLISSDNQILVKEALDKTNNTFNYIAKNLGYIVSPSFKINQTSSFTNSYQRPVASTAKVLNDTSSMPSVELGDKTILVDFNISRSLKNTKTDRFLSSVKLEENNYSSYTPDYLLFNAKFNSDEGVEVFKEAVKKLNIDVNISTSSYKKKYIEETRYTTNNIEKVILSLKLKKIKLDEFKNLLNKGLEINGDIIEIVANSREEVMEKYEALNISDYVDILNYKTLNEKERQEQKYTKKLVNNYVEIKTKNINKLSELVNLLKLVDADIYFVEANVEDSRKDEIILSAIKSSSSKLKGMNYILRDIKLNYTSISNNIYNIYYYNKDMKYLSLDEVLKEVDKNKVLYDIKLLNILNNMTIEYGVGI